MPLRLTDGWTGSSDAGTWRLDGMPPFAPSRAYELLRRDLRRYTLEEVSGRSFLIAGHRGAGKTATVVHAIRQLRNELLADSVNRDTIPIGRRGRLQRPLLVKLVGQSLVAAPPSLKPAKPDAPTEPPEDQGAGSDETGDGEGGSGEAEAAAERNALGEVPAAAEAPPDPVASALVHITIALYRALSDEIAKSFRKHALDSDDRDMSERLELAAQFELELDGTPDPASLRLYWDRLGRLSRGILWPAGSDDAIIRSGIPDQGLKEVVALATAAQAFQVCSGAITYSEQRQKFDRTTSKTKSGLDTKEVITRLGAMGAGALAGSVVGVEEGTAPGVGIGLLVWLLASLTLTWEGSRQSNRTQSVNYTFLRDRSIQTLDRDLPLVIERIRDAGLAPVFVIDELDKLEKADEQIAEIIHRLKHLVADFGFFCFLTGRDYFDEVERKVAAEPYPTEHTYFTERVLVLNRAEDLFRYLLRLLEEEPDDTSYPLRAAVFALVIMFRSKLNFSDIGREVAKLTNAKDMVLCSDEELQAPGRYRVTATIQIAINRILASTDVAERMKTDASFAQLAIDALYYIPRQWEADSDAPVDLSEEAIKRDLLKRMGATSAPVGGGGPSVPPVNADPAAPPGNASPADPPPAPEPPPAPAQPVTIRGPESRELVEMVWRLAGYLQDFALLRSELEGDAQSPEHELSAADLRLLAQIVVVEKERLLRPAAEDTPHLKRFQLDELGRFIPDPAAPQRRFAGADNLSPPGPEETFQREAPPDEELLQGGRLLEEISALMKTAGLAVDDLAAHDILPATLTNRLLARTLRDIAVALANPANRDARERALDGRLAFEQAFEARGPLVGVVLRLAVLARSDSVSREPLRQVLSRLGRHVDPSSPPTDLPAESQPGVRLSSDPDTIAAYRDELARWMTEVSHDPSRLNQLDMAEEWKKWRDEIGEFLRSDRWPPHRTTYADFLLAAADLAPGSIFRAQLGRMDQFDWSRAALKALATREWPPVAPLWVLIASLRMLGFDGRLLRRLTDSAPPAALKMEKEDAFLARYVAEMTAEADPAVLYLREASAGRRGMDIDRAHPVLSLSKEDLVLYAPGLGWLANNGAFLGGAYDEGSGLSPTILSSELLDLTWAAVSRKSAPNEQVARSGLVTYDVRIPADLHRAVRRQLKPA